MDRYLTLLPRREQLEHAVKTINYWGTLFGFKYGQPLLDPERVRALKKEHPDELSKEVQLYA